MVSENKDLKGKLLIIGIGPGNRKYILPAAVEAMESCDVIIGFSRAVESVDFVNTPKFKIDSLTATLNYLLENEDKRVALIASGDPCFYGITDYICKNYKGSIEVIPGLSSFQYMFAKLKKSWQGAALGSLHGREEDLINVVKGKRISFWLTDKINTPAKIAAKLLKAGVEAIMHIGEDLSYDNEKISSLSLREVLDRQFSELTVVIIEAEREQP